MATVPNKNLNIVLGTEDLVLGMGSEHSVSRYRLHVTAISGTVTVKARIPGSGQTAVAANVVTTVGSTTTGSTITATGLYDLDSSGLELTLSSGTSMTFSYFPVEG